MEILIFWYICFRAFFFFKEGKQYSGNSNTPSPIPLSNEAAALLYILSTQTLHCLNTEISLAMLDTQLIEADHFFFPTTKCSKSALGLNSFIDTHGILNQLSKPSQQRLSWDRGQAVICHCKVLYSRLIFTLVSLSSSKLSIPIKTEQNKRLN